MQDIIKYEQDITMLWQYISILGQDIMMLLQYISILGHPMDFFLTITQLWHSIIEVKKYYYTELVCLAFVSQE